MVLSRRIIYPKKAVEILIFFRTLSEGLNQVRKARASRGSPEKFENLEAQNCHFMHFQQDIFD